MAQLHNQISHAACLSSSSHLERLFFDRIKICFVIITPYFLHTTKSQQSPSVYYKEPLLPGKI